MIGARIAGIKKPRTMAGLSYPNVINLHVESRGETYKKIRCKSTLGTVWKHLLGVRQILPRQKDKAPHMTGLEVGLLS